MHKIKVLNKISEAGLSLFGKNYDYAEDIADPDAILVRSATVDTDEYKQLLSVARAGAGVNNISISKATEKGVCVFNTPGANANAVAELVFIGMGLCARNIKESFSFIEELSREQDDKVISEKVEKQKSKFRGFELEGKVLGVIGLGKIGVRVANGGMDRGMQVVAFEPFPSVTNFHALNPGVEYVRSMEDLLGRCDILSVHVPLADKTRNLINEDAISMCKEGCIFLNYARKGIFDDDAVVKALDSGKLLNYVTDFPSKELLAHPKVICTPHLGASTTESEENCSVMAIRQLRNYMEYGTINNSVNFPVVDVVPQQSTKSRLIVINKDVPNMIADITNVLGKADINIQSLTNESNGKIGYNIIDFDQRIEEKTIAPIQKIENVIRYRLLQFK